MQTLEVNPTPGLLKPDPEIPPVCLNHYRIDYDLLSILPRTLAMQYHVVPIEQKGNSLTLAISDPADLQTMDTVRFYLDTGEPKEIRWVTTPWEEIESAILHGYPSYS